MFDFVLIKSMWGHHCFTLVDSSIYFTPGKDIIIMQFKSKVLCAVCWCFSDGLVKVQKLLRLVTLLICS